MYIINIDAVCVLIYFIGCRICFSGNLEFVLPLLVYSVSLQKCGWE